MIKPKDGRNKNLKVRLKELLLCLLMLVSWGALKAFARLNTRSEGSRKIDNLIFLTPHASNPCASKGDEAMLVAIVDKLRSENPNIDLAIALEKADLTPELTALGLRPVGCWTYPWSLRRVFKAVSRFDSVFCIGADVLDGYYSDVKSLRLWLLLDLVARMGNQSVIGGFSFNAQPAFFTKFFISKLASTDIVVNLRDPISCSRFKALSSLEANLVADNAFMLQPASSISDVSLSSWLKNSREEQRKLVAFNVHPILVPDRSDEAMLKIIQNCSQAVDQLVEEGCDVVFVAHDFRDMYVGDVWMLSEIVSHCHCDPKHLFTAFTNISAAEIKYIVSKLDLVITGRMHLSIAALGSGVPILGVTYQGKFDGLIELFALPNDVLATPEQLQDANWFRSFCSEGVKNLDVLRGQVNSRLSVVSSMAEDNLSGL